MIAEYVKTGKAPKQPIEDRGPNGLPISPVTGKEFMEDQLMTLMMQMMTMGNVECVIVCNENATSVRLDMLPELFANRLTGGDVIKVIENGTCFGDVHAGWSLPTPGLVEGRGEFDSEDVVAPYSARHSELLNSMAALGGDP